MTDPVVEALLREREAYLAAGRQDRAAQVAAELARHGVEVSTAGKVEDAGGGSAGRRSGRR